jgi:DNA polymerase-4
MQVIHLDVADFAVAVERVVDPGLCGRPVIVAPDTDRALVATVSREARRDGVRPGMPLREALRCCRSARLIRPNESLYARAFKAVGELAGRFSPVLEPGSPGRIYLDVTGTGRLFGPPLDLAARLRRDLADRLHLDAAVGVAANKLVSRVAADLTEPAGLLDVRTGDEGPFLAPLRVRQLPGIGAAVGRELDALNIRWVRQLAVMEPAHLDLAFGRFGAVLQQRARGVDPRPVRPPLRKPEVRREETLEEDSNDPAVLRAVYRALVESAGLELRARGLTAARMALELMYADSRTTARSVRARHPLQQIPELWCCAETLLETALSRRVRVRHLRFRLAGLARRPRQMEMFAEPSPDGPLTAALDRIRTRFGETAVIHGLQVERVSAC